MKIQNLKKSFMCMLAAVISLACLADSASAQQGGQRVRVAPVVGSPMPGSTPRLGFMGEMIYGYGMRVLGTNYGSPAQMAGLERGDVIFSINGRRILCQYDYNNALMDAVFYRGGYVSLRVRNVRYDMGLSYQQFVYVSTRAIGGGAMPVMGAPAVQGGMGQGGMGQGGMGQGGMLQGGMQVRSRQGGVQVRSRQGSQRSAKQAGQQQRQKIAEISSDKVPAIGQSKGSSQ